MARGIFVCILALGLPLAIPGVTHGVEIANSVTDFSGVQGGNGWSYGYYDAIGFKTDFLQFTGSQWWFNGSQGPVFSPTITHPGWDVTEGLKAVRRWVSDGFGTVDVMGDLEVPDVQSDGTLAIFLVDGIEQMFFVRPKGSTQAFWGPFLNFLVIPGQPTYEYQMLGVDLNKGSAFDIILDDYGDGSYDTTVFTAQIEPAQWAPEPGTMALLALGALGVLNRRKRRTF